MTEIRLNKLWKQKVVEIEGRIGDLSAAAVVEA
jgi:hypothetical protein